MGVVSYLTFDGEILGENRAGVEVDYLPEPLGSVVALTDNSATVAGMRTYWPYGEVKSQTGSWITPFCFVGSLGYYQDTWGGTYVRAREFRQDNTRWQSVDPMWPGPDPYAYAVSNPLTFIDATGLSPTCQGSQNPFQNVPPTYLPSWPPRRSEDVIEKVRCANCAWDIIVMWWLAPQHKGHNKYIHCLACCILTRLYGPDCAKDAQAMQNRTPFFAGHQDQQDSRGYYCNEGVSIAAKSGQCSDLCSAKFDPPKGPKTKPPPKPPCH